MSKDLANPHKFAIGTLNYTVSGEFGEDAPSTYHLILSKGVGDDNPEELFRVDFQGINANSDVVNRSIFNTYAAATETLVKMNPDAF